MGEEAIRGLLLVKGFLSAREQDALIDCIEAGPWSNELKRRVQHFGYRYDYAARHVMPSVQTPPVPEWGARLVRRMLAEGIATQEFDQLIVNEYLPGQGIAPHADSLSSFADEIVSISLGSACVMTFSSATSQGGMGLLLEPGDLLLIKGPARRQWRHQIKPRQSDRWEGRVIKRGRRLSVTFRKVLSPRRELLT
jgi:alkylated DNA repair dioxygenase AlkB